MTKEQLAQEYAANRILNLFEPEYPVYLTEREAEKGFLAGYAACEERYAALLAAAEALVNPNGTFELSNGKLWELRTALNNIKTK